MHQYQYSGMSQIFPAWLLADPLHLARYVNVIVRQT